MKNQLTIIVLALLVFAPFSGNTVEMKNPAPAAKTEPSGQATELKKAQTATEVLSSAQKGKLLDLLNKGSEKDLSAIRGIAAGKTKAIIAKRPFQSVEDVVKVKGIGLATFARVVAHGKNPSSPKTPTKS